MKHVGNNGVYISDRGGDRINLFGPLLDRNARVLVRLVETRNLVYNNKTMRPKEVARTCPCLFRKTIVKLEGDREVCHELRFGHRKVHLPDRPEPLYLLVIHGFGAEPLMLMVTEPLRRIFKCLWRAGYGPTCGAGAPKRPSATSRPATTSIKCASSTTRDFRTSCHWCWPQCFSPHVYSTMTNGCVSWPNTSKPPRNGYSAYPTSSTTHSQTG